jgi:hypothetical protein
MDMNVLQQLCAHYGIATDYHDLSGNHHAVQPQALQTLLAAFDPQLASDPSGSDALERARSATWDQLIAPTVAIRDDYTHWGVCCGCRSKRGSCTGSCAMRMGISSPRPSRMRTRWERTARPSARV